MHLHMGPKLERHVCVASGKLPYATGLTAPDALHADTTLLSSEQTRIFVALFVLQLLTIATQDEYNVIAAEARAIDWGPWVGLESLNRQPTTNKADFRWLSTNRTTRDDWWLDGEPNNAGGLEGICVHITAIVGNKFRGKLKLHCLHKDVLRHGCLNLLQRYQVRLRCAMHTAQLMQSLDPLTMSLCFLLQIWAAQVRHDRSFARSVSDHACRTCLAFPIVPPPCYLGAIATYHMCFACV